MEGVKILSEQNMQSTICIYIVMAILIGVAIWISCTLALNNFIFSTILSVIIALIFGISFVEHAKSVGPAYDVTVDESVSWKDFNEKYKVIEQNGEIVRVILKEQATD